MQIAKRNFLHHKLIVFASQMMPRLMKRQLLLQLVKEGCYLFLAMLMIYAETSEGLRNTLKLALFLMLLMR